MKIAIVGTGYVGLVSGTCFSDMGIDVTCIDVNEEKIKSLQKGVVPIYEPGLEDMILKNTQAGRLHFEMDLACCIDSVDAIFIAVGTPPDENGSADLHYVLDVAHQIGRLLNSYAVVVTKSTVPVGTSKLVKTAIKEELKARGANVKFDVASNPEFLKEGNAINDFMKPDRIVVGVESEKAEAVMGSLYKPFMVKSNRIIFTNIPSAEMIKYAANSMLATRISFMNEVANLCEVVGADVDMVRQGIGSDSRIGNQFLYPGCGYGGSCFPKDVKAMIHTAESKGCPMKVLSAVEEVNDEQKNVLFKKFSRFYKGNVLGKRVAIWGLAFKPETDDMREATALRLISQLLDVGCSVNVYDPIAMPECRRRIGDVVTYCASAYDVFGGADAFFLVTEWKEFRVPDWEKIKSLMKRPVVFDGRNIFSRKEVEGKGFEYERIG